MYRKTISCATHGPSYLTGAMLATRRSLAWSESGKRVPTLGTLRDVTMGSGKEARAIDGNACEWIGGHLARAVLCLCLRCGGNLSGRRSLLLSFLLSVLLRAERHSHNRTLRTLTHLVHLPLSSLFTLALHRPHPPASSQPARRISSHHRRAAAAAPHRSPLGSLAGYPRLVLVVSRHAEVPRRREFGVRTGRVDRVKWRILARLFAEMLQCNHMVCSATGLRSSGSPASSAVR